MSPPHLTPLARQVLAAILLHHPFTHPPSPLFPGFSTSSLLPILSSLPSLLFLPASSLGRQPLSSSRRHRSPLKPHHHQPPPTPTSRVLASLSLKFYSWAHFHFHSLSLAPHHHPSTCLAMARLLARSRHLPPLWQFLKHNRHIVSTPTVTEIIKILGEQGLSQHALHALHRLEQLHCKPDVQCYNTTISALCNAGDFKNARFLLSQMELPGARCPPDAYTYTIFISFYCKRSLQTGCRKAIRRRIWEANHMFRHMVLKGFEPDVVTYNCLIDGLCKTYRIRRAHELFDEMVGKGCLPNRVTYNSFVRYYSVVNEVDKGIGMMREMVARGHGVATCSTYTPIVHSLCEAGRVREARDFLFEMVGGGGGCLPREFTYRLVCDALKRDGDEGLPLDMCRRIEGGMDERYRRVMKVKPLMGRRRDGFVRQEGRYVNLAESC